MPARSHQLTHASSKDAPCLLVAENDPMLRGLVTMLLNDAGYKTIEARDGKEALRLASEKLDTIDLLLTDDQMPGLNGYELIRLLRAKRPDLKVVVMSGAGDIGEVSGVVLLPKPFSLEALTELVAGLLEDDAAG